mmetsp:Transcript_2935/g.10792  ORF Transcript_2935/g.10792 Transcript_2935/m.10792 type:complete len:212 (-) Transcript_2935:206-841(-)
MLSPRRLEPLERQPARADLPVQPSQPLLNLPLLLPLCERPSRGGRHLGVLGLQTLLLQVHLEQEALDLLLLTLPRGPSNIHGVGAGRLARPPPGLHRCRQRINNLGLGHRHWLFGGSQVLLRLQGFGCPRPRDHGTALVVTPADVPVDALDGLPVGRAPGGEHLLAGWGGRRGRNPLDLIPGRAAQLGRPPWRQQKPALARLERLDLSPQI